MSADHTMHRLFGFKFGALSILLIATCLPARGVPETILPLDAAKLLAKLEALDGKTGKFEGVYTSGLHEGAHFKFCTENECPDMNELDCDPNFSGQAASDMQEMWDKHDGESVYMIASGAIRTGAKSRDFRGYEHMSAQACQIEISKVSQLRVVEGLLVRSKEFPDLTKLPE